MLPGIAARRFCALRPGVRIVIALDDNFAWLVEYAQVAFVVVGLGGCICSGKKGPARIGVGFAIIRNSDFV
ncbi:hypothetical protein D3C87_2073740 [compost metagenome]